MSEIVVGVDGSAGSRRALQWAFDQARRTDALLLVVHAYRPEVGPRGATYSYSYLPANAVRLHGEHEREQADAAQANARQRAEALVQRALDDLESSAGGDDGPAVKRLALAQDPARALIEVSRTASMLVLGGRTRGGSNGFSTSVSRRCLDRARCPVVIVR